MAKKRSRLLLACLACVLAWLPAGCGRIREQYSGKVVGISDGDTIEVLRGATVVKIRLWGIDCPEHGQAFGDEAKKNTSRLAFGQIVQVKTMSTDAYGRTVAKIFLPDGAYLNREIVAAGYAWWYRRYASRASDIAAAEAEAKNRKLGLWADPHPTPPWIFREEERAVARPRSPTGNSPIQITYLHCHGTGVNEPDEYVEISNRSASSVALAGWMLHDEHTNHQLIFPPGFSLEAAAGCKIYTNQAGGCLSFGVARSAVWNNSGDTAYLVDPSGAVRATRRCDD